MDPSSSAPPPSPSSNYNRHHAQDRNGLVLLVDLLAVDSIQGSIGSRVFDPFDRRSSVEEGSGFFEREVAEGRRGKRESKREVLTSDSGRKPGPWGKEGRSREEDVLTRFRWKRSRP